MKKRVHRFIHFRRVNLMRKTESKKILIVDDDLLSIATISQTLLRNGYQVVHATDEDRAFKSSKKDKPDLIMCNYESKKLDVKQLLKSIQNVRTSHGIPFLMITESRDSLNDEPAILGPKQHLNRDPSHASNS